MSKFDKIAKLEAELKNVEQEICFALRGKEWDDLDHFREVRREVIADLKSVK